VISNLDYDYNLSPDKREIIFKDENEILEAIKF
jgi:DNA mismatch repair ATPase MutL